MNATEFTQTTETINGAEVTVYRGRAVLAYAVAGHFTGWQKRNGARVTYAELTCTCHLTGEAVSPEGEGRWISYGEDGWADRLNALALAHVTNVTANAFMIRPAKGDRSRWADRHRVNLLGILEAMAEAGVADQAAAVVAGRAVTAPNGVRFELARDRSSHYGERLPIA